MSGQSTAAAVKLGGSPLQRRERRRVSLRGYAVREDGSNVEVLLLDLSYEGCGIEAPVPLKQGELLRLAVLKRGAIQARVRWSRGSKAGLVFESSQADDKAYLPRRLERHALSAEVAVRRLGRIAYRARAFDVSADGCKVELVDRPKLAEHVLVKFDGLESLEAEVCWIAGTCAGLRFERPIHPAVLSLMLERLA
ncbi:MAG: PilZ domain-containing protein [Bacillota bacterium]